jgi:hypothetical protein
VIYTRAGAARRRRHSAGSFRFHLAIDRPTLIMVRHGLKILTHPMGMIIRSGKPSPLQEVIA